MTPDETFEIHFKEAAYMHATLFVRFYKENSEKQQTEMMTLTQKIDQVQTDLETEKQKNIYMAVNFEEFVQKIGSLETKLTNTLQRMTMLEQRNGGEGVGIKSTIGFGGVSDIRKEIVVQVEKNSDGLKQLTSTVGSISQNLSDVDLRHQLHENTTYTGHMIWKIDNFGQRYEQAVIGKTTALHSAPSFTDKYGYKFCARLYLNGDGMGKGTHVSLFFVLMKSEFDSLLVWPFNKTVTFTLLNQENAEKNVKESFNADVKSSSFKRPTKHMNIASGCPFFVAQEKLKEPGNGFIKDGCFYLDIKVK